MSAKKVEIANKRLYRQRNRIKRMIGHFETNYVIATRYDKPTESFCGMVQLITTIYELKSVHTAWLGPDRY